MLPIRKFIGNAVISYGSSTCSGTINNEEQTINSRNYPRDYGSYENCHWRIQTSVGGRIELKFLDFRTQGSTRDYLTVYNGGRISSSQQIGNRLGGNINPSDIVSTGNQMYITWTSDYSSEYRGFEIEIRAFGKFTFIFPGCEE